VPCARRAAVESAIDGRLDVTGSAGRRRRRSAVAIAALLAGTWSGCSGLIVRADDSPAERRSKAGVRTALSVVTLGVFPKIQAEAEHAERRRSTEARVRAVAARYRRLWLHRILTARTSEQMRLAFGGPPRWCRPSGEGHELCTWSTAGILVRALYEPETPSGRVDVPFHATPSLSQVVIATCELPVDGSSRAPRSCDVSFW
jgi:hypothetical protein